MENLSIKGTSEISANGFCASPKCSARKAFLAANGRSPSQEEQRSGWAFWPHPATQTPEKTGKKLKPKHFFTLLLSLGCAATNAGDQRQVESVFVSATRLETDSGSLTGSYTSLSEEQLDRVKPVHIQQLLQRAPGVNLHRGNGQEYLPAIRSPVLTGPGACGAFLMLEDNIPLRAAGFCNINELFGAHFEQARRVEIIHGPAAAFYGSNALHGAVNIVTPKPGPSTPAGVSLEGGRDDYARLKLSGAAGAEDNAWRVGITASHDGGYRDNSGYDQQKLSLRHHFQGDLFTIDSGFTYTGLNQETAGFITGPDAYRDERLARANPTPEAARDTRSLRLWSRIKHNRLQLTPYVRHNSMDFLQHFLPGDPLEENGHDSAGLLASYQLQGSDTREITLGFDTEYTRGYLKQSQALPTRGSAFLRETIPAGRHYDYRVDAFTASPFVHFERVLSERWNLTAGLRFDYTRYDYNNRLLPGHTRDDGSPCGFGGCRYSRPADRNDSFANFSPKLGLAYNLSPQHRLHLNLSRGFRAPQTTELYRLQRGQVVADLDSEFLTSIELGIKGNTEKLDYTLALYQLDKRNVILRDTDFFNVADGKTRHQGLELQLSYSLTPTLTLNYSGTYARHQYRNNPGLSSDDIRGNDIDTAPRYFSTLQLGWRFAAVALELEWVYMGDYYLEPENRFSYPGHDLVHLRGNWQAAPNLQFSAQLTNIGDAAYAERADFTSFTGERYFPGAPRSLVAGIQWQWK